MGKLLVRKMLWLAQNQDWQKTGDESFPVYTQNSSLHHHPLDQVPWHEGTDFKEVNANLFPLPRQTALTLPESSNNCVDSAS